MLSSQVKIAQLICLSGLPALKVRLAKLELELVQSHMAQKLVLRGEVGCACVAREVSVERGGMGDAGVQGAWVPCQVGLAASSKWDGNE